MFVDVYFCGDLFSETCFEISKLIFKNGSLRSFSSTYSVIFFITHCFPDIFTMIVRFGCLTGVSNTSCFDIFEIFNILIFLIFLIFWFSVVSDTSVASDAHSRPTLDRRHCIVLISGSTPGGVGIQTCSVLPFFSVFIWPFLPPFTPCLLPS